MVEGLSQAEEMLLVLNRLKKSSEIYPSSVRGVEKISRRKKMKSQRKARRLNRV
jgi:hypothetical protein